MLLPLGQLGRPHKNAILNIIIIIIRFNVHIQNKLL